MESKNDEFHRAWNEMNRTFELMRNLTLTPTQAGKHTVEVSGIHGGMQ